MRLIDADELLEHVYRDRLDSRELIANMVENAPTVSQWIPCSEQMIDRQAAIDALLGDKVVISDIIRVLGNERDFEVFNSACDRHAEMIKVLPSAKPNSINQWIPCRERLPDQQKAVLIQDFKYITIGYLNGENHWRDLTNIDGYLKGVVAWMPLPEPYKEVTA